jgi:hypothetical protein
LQVYGVFRKKVTVVKGSFPQVTEIKNVTVWATEKRQILPKITQICLGNISDGQTSVRRRSLGP